MLSRLILLSLAACAGVLGIRASRGDEPSAVPPPAPVSVADTVTVPDVRKLSALEAAVLLARTGLNLETIFEHRYDVSYRMGMVVQQKPEPGTRAPYASGVLVMVMSEGEGEKGGRAPDPSWPRAAPRPATAPRPAPSNAPAPIPLPPRAPTPAPAPEAPPAVPTPAPTVLPATVPPQPPASPTPEAAVPGPSPLPAMTGPLGSPDAPAMAERAKPGVVPDLKGLSLNDAEQRMREAELLLYVERVPGHPVGRVLTQVPDAGSERAPGSVVKVTVTAGGDYEGERPPAPSVEVTRVTVPDLLDRTPLQAGRILTALGLAMKQEAAANGPAGCVVDQKPGYGQEVTKGSVVTVWVTPPPAKAPSPLPTPGPGPLPTSGPGGPPSPPRPPPPGPATPLPTSPAAAPQTVSPPEGTIVPKERTVPVGFTWTAVAGAEAYVLEVEEQNGDAWIANVRKPVRSSACTVDVERLAPTPGALRWRVRALVSGVEGTATPWVTLR
jgi:beta-lactam-binding protein with PASTA domain